MQRNIFDFQSDVCKAFSNPRRLEILNLLKKSELSVSDIISSVKLSKTNVSQHLAVMRLRGLVKTRRDGTTIYYRIANQKLAYACSLMQDVLSQILEAEDEQHSEHKILRNNAASKGDQYPV